VFQNPGDLTAASPIGAVPVLVTPDFGPLCDSTNILEYLHEKTGAIWPKAPRARTEVRQASVLAMAVVQASVLYYQEVFMHEVPSRYWSHDHVSVMEATLAKIAESSKNLWLNTGELTQAGWDLAVALEYASLRVPFLKWQDRHPSLNDVIIAAKKDPFFIESTPRL
jgi:glutathione S-transferase